MDYFAPLLSSYTHTHTHTHTHTYIYIYIYIYIYRCVHIYVCVYTHVYTHTQHNLSKCKENNHYNFLIEQIIFVIIIFAYLSHFPVFTVQENLTSIAKRNHLLAQLKLSLNFHYRPLSSWLADLEHHRDIPAVGWLVGSFVLRRINPFRVIERCTEFQTIQFSISIGFCLQTVKC